MTTSPSASLSRKTQLPNSGPPATATATASPFSAACSTDVGVPIALKGTIVLLPENMVDREAKWMLRTNASLIGATSAVEAISNARW